LVASIQEVTTDFMASSSSDMAKVYNLSRPR
jgi:hypothetical protein